VKLKHALSFAVLAAVVAVPAQRIPIPIETNAQRKPTLVTHGDLFIRDARILTATHGVIEKGSILVKGGKIAAIGNLTPPPGIPVIEAAGKVVSPGIVDAHVHRGIDTTNEGTDAITAEGRVSDVLNPDAKTLWQALASGETSALILHGSANPIGAQSLVIKIKYGHPLDDLAIPDAPRMIKFALGENVTRSGQDNATRFPHTRMGVQAVYRRAFTEAREYIKKWDAYEKKKATDPKATPPQRDLRLETLADILKRKIWVQCHSYRADEILMLVRTSQEFGFKVGAMQHALESYKVAPELAKAGIGVSIFSDEWAGKLEMYDSIPFAASILTKAGVNVSINTDGVSGTTAINLDAAKVMRYGGVTEQQALDMITINPARELGIDHRTGSIDVGKDADIVIWDGHPLSVYSKVDTTIIEGEVMFQRRDAFKVDGGSVAKNKLDPVRYVAHPDVPKPSKVYAIVGGAVYPVDGPVIPNGTVVLVDGKVKAVGRNVAIPKDAVRVDAHGLRVYPGFIDAGTTIGLTEYGQVGQATDASEFGTLQPDLIGLTAVNVQSEHIPTARVDGVTTVVTSPRGGSISGQASVMNMAGWTNELMGLKPMAGLMVNWPGGGFSPEDFEVDDDGDSARGAGAQGPRGGGSASVGDIRSYFDRALKYGKEHDAVDVQMEAMQPYVTGKLPVFIRIRSREGIRSAVEFVKKYKLKTVFLGAPECWKETALLVQNKIPVIIAPAGNSTLSANVTSTDWDPYDTPYATPALLKRAGVKFCFQTDDYAESHQLRSRVGESCAYGLPVDTALRAITLTAAEILGVSDQIGSITPGKLGNLVICDGDPFEMTSCIRYVFIKGQPVPLTSKWTRLRDQYLQRVP